MLFIVDEANVDMFDSPVPGCCVIGPWVEIS